MQSDGMILSNHRRFWAIIFRHLNIIFRLITWKTDLKNGILLHLFQNYLITVVFKM